MFERVNECWMSAGDESLRQTNASYECEPRFRDAQLGPIYSFFKQSLPTMSS